MWRGAFAGALTFAVAQMAFGQGMTLPKTLVAASAVSIPTSGSGKAVLYIVGPGQALRADVNLGEAATFPAGVLYNAGHYVAVLTGGSNDSGEFDVTPAAQPATLGFLAKPSRIAVGLHGGISGAVYVFDAYHNLITTPMPASLELSLPSGSNQSRSVTTKNGLAWATMDSAPKEGAAKFTAHVGDASSIRIIQQVPGDPCSIAISAHPDGKKVEVETNPVKDCSGNAIPDGTIVTFIETFNNVQTTVDVPLKQGSAKVLMPSYPGSKISAAIGVVAGNEIRWGGGN